VLTLVRRARRRLFGNELLAQGANATSAALGALILLLLVGTQILNWQWALLIPLVAAIAGFYRARKRLPTPYAVAQIVDRRMALEDTLSTAFFFSQDEAASRADAEVRQWQFDRATRMAESVDVRKAIPFTIPRTIYLMAALILVASSLFALRYGLTRRLDLQPPLATILEQTFGTNERTEQARNNRKLPQPEPQTQPDDSGGNVQDPDQKAVDQPDADAANASEESSDSKTPGDAKAANADAKRQAEEGEKSDGDQKDAQGDERSGEGESPNGQKGDSKSDPKQDAAAKQDSQNSGDSSSLMSKVKDAMQNLLSRMKPQQSQSGAQQQQSAMDQKNSQGKGQQNGSKQQSGKDGQQQNGGQQGDAQEGQSGEQAQDAQDPQGKGTGKSENQQPSKQPGSGIGSQDGDKSIKQAEQLAAMGKISEIFGKRSANITGEATVEVQNTSQQLRTQYTQRGVQHSQSGAEINRDEIPVALQPYVAQYFEQVRKQKK